MSAGPAGVVIEVGPDRLRALRADDCERLLAWRNQTHIRAVSFSQGEIDPETHRAWFARVLARTDGLWCVFERGGLPLGHVNAVRDGEAPTCWRWSFYIGATDAPPGAGTAMLGLMIEALRRRGDVRCVLAETLAGNGASERLHEKLGFARLRREGGATRWRLALDGAAAAHRPGATGAPHAQKDTP